MDYPVDLRLVAECVDSSLPSLQDLNPALLRMTTPKDGTYDLRLPAGSSEKFQTTIAGIPRDKRVWWRYYKVQSGESLSEIARQFRTTTSSIAEVNNIAADDEIRPGMRLVIPVTPRRESEGLAFSKKPTIYKVRKGDTVLSVADDFSVPVEKVRQWNHLKGNTLKAGRTLGSIVRRRDQMPVRPRWLRSPSPTPRAAYKLPAKLFTTRSRRARRCLPSPRTTTPRSPRYVAPTARRPAI